MDQNRRTFLKMLGAASALWTAPSARARGAPPEARAPSDRPRAPHAAPAKLERIGIQLYSLRQLASVNLASVLERLSKIGYREVETAGYYGHSAADVRDLLARYKLTAPSAHLPVEAIEQSPDEVFGDARTIGHQWITVPSPSGRMQTLDDWKAFAARLNHAAGLTTAAGFKFSYHNHEAEFKAINGTVPWDVLMHETDATRVYAQIDLYHAVNGGADPLDLLARYGPRIKMLHVKDMGRADRRMVDVGAGTIDFKTIFAHARGIEHYFVENDNPADALTFAANSYAYLSTLSF